MAWLAKEDFNNEEKAFYSIPMKLAKIKDAARNEKYRDQLPRWKKIAAYIPLVGRIYSSFINSSYQKQFDALEEEYQRINRQAKNVDTAPLLTPNSNTSKLEQLADITQRLFKLNKQILTYQSVLGNKKTAILEKSINTLRKNITASWKTAIENNHKTAVKVNAITDSKLALHAKNTNDHDKWLNVRHKFGGLFYTKLKVNNDNIDPSTQLNKLTLADKKTAKKFHWQTTKDKVDAVLNNRSSLDEATIKRYEQYQAQIEQGQQPALPKYYHATTLDNLVSILDDGVITPSDSRKGRPGTWVSTSPEIGENTMLRRGEPSTENNVCGFMFSDAIEKYELAKNNRLAMTNFLINTAGKDAHVERLWIAFKKHLSIIDRADNSLHSSVAGLFFTNENAYENFLSIINNKPALAQLIPTLREAGRIVIGTENLLHEQKVLQGETLYPAQWQPRNWHNGL